MELFLFVPNGFYFVTTGQIFEAALYENSINPGIRFDDVGKVMFRILIKYIVYF